EDSLGFKEQQIFTYLTIGRIFEEVGDYYQSAHFLDLALDLNYQSKNTGILVLILNKLGKLNASMGRMDEAFENYETVLKYKNEIEQPEIEAEALSNLGHLYKFQGKYGEALTQHKNSLA